MKYVIIDDPSIIGLEQPIMFEDSFAHSNFAKWNPKSAGFVAIENGEYHTYGFSESLQMGPRPEDARIIRRAHIVRKPFVEGVV